MLAAEAIKATGNLEALRSDPLVKTLATENLRQRRIYEYPKITINFWRLRVCFACKLLRTGDPFHGMTPFGKESGYAPLEFDRYSDDLEFMKAVAELRRSGILVILVHIPSYKEMSAHPDGGFEFGAYGVPPLQGKGLVEDLQRRLGRPWVELYRYYPSTLKDDPLKLVYSKDNSHPTAAGVEAMADALEQALREDSGAGRLFRLALGEREPSARSLTGYP